MCWTTTTDKFAFNINFQVSQSQFTKRSTLATIARLFDPLGWLNPFVTKAKFFLNKLWDEDLTWDDPFSPKLQSEWKEIINQLQSLNKIEIPRWLNTNRSNIRNEMHIFCDSSQKAYSTAAYLRTIDNSENIHVKLLVAKSKLSPIRKPLTIPRSELCGAVLSVKLLKFLESNFRLKINQTYMWTDSSIVLSWIKGDPNRWTTFVCNRVNKILEITNIEDWSHVVSKDNPADCNSRGLTVVQLHESSLWWTGPDWLSKSHEGWPTSKFNFIEDDPSELRSKFKSINATINEPNHLDSMLNRFSNFNRIRRSIAYCFRFIQQTRDAIKLRKPRTTSLGIEISKLIEMVPPLNVIEIQQGEIALIRWVQRETFVTELESIQMNEPIQRISKLFRLNPFIDSAGTLRVNGR